VSIVGVCLSVCLSRHVHVLVYGNGGTYPKTYPASRTIPVVPTRHYYAFTISETVQDRHIYIIYYEIVQLHILNNVILNNLD